MHNQSSLTLAVVAGLEIFAVSGTGASFHQAQAVTVRVIINDRL